MKKRLLFAAFGILATLVGVGMGHFVASLLNPASSPVLAVGSTVIDLTPTPMKEWAIRTFGDNDKRILIGSVMAGVLVFAAIAGVLTRRRFAVGAGMLVFLVAVAAGAAATRPAVEAVDFVPPVFTALAAVAALWWLHRTAVPQVAAAPASTRPDVETTSVDSGSSEHLPDDVVVRTGEDKLADADAAAPPPSRRAVLITMGVLAAVAAALGGTGRWIEKYRARPEDIALPDPADPAPAFPKGLDDQVPGITTFRTSNADFYRVDTRLDTPVVESDGWTLTVDGDVENELEISFDELLEMPMIERDITMTCVSNTVGGKYVGAARWLGVPLTDVLDMAGVGDKADQILSTDFDGMTISTPLELATDGRDAMIVVGMNGEQLPREHGFPVRMIVPGLYGFISGTKWLSKLTLTTYEQEKAYWTDREWATDAPIKISARIDTPKSLSTVEKGEVVIGGVAWAQRREGVAKVEVRIDGGEWQEATLGPDAGSDYWRQWFYRWDASGASGNVFIAARAIAGNGETQTDVKAMSFPDGSSGIHEYLVNVA